ncbi:MAG: 3-isopropylmalate dehydratase small subunit [Deltaproteobacteria bacterium]|nr:3-isopropylmalate dehydratase small subunit [Deltaproteobacteria bacterium]
MEKITIIKGLAAPLAIKNIDTDLIIPAQHMTNVSREGYGKYLFERLRADANFILLQPKYKSASILIADENFGCGSSREHAVWALEDGGFRCVIAKSFADIFFNNSAKNGLLLIKLPEEQINAFQKQATNEDLLLEIDLKKQTISYGQSASIPFDYDEFRKYCLLNGLDDIDYLTSYKADIERYRQEKEPYNFLKLF